MSTLVAMLQLELQSSPAEPLLPLEKLSYSTKGDGGPLDGTPFASSKNARRPLNDSNYDPEIFLNTDKVRFYATAEVRDNVVCCFFYYSIILMNVRFCML